MEKLSICGSSIICLSCSVASLSKPMLSATFTWMTYSLFIPKPMFSRSGFGRTLFRHAVNDFGEIVSPSLPLFAPAVFRFACEGLFCPCIPHKCLVDVVGTYLLLNRSLIVVTDAVVHKHALKESHLSGTMKINHSE